jgi:capsular exopolysaccharide synthesis family protein
MSDQNIENQRIKLSVSPRELIFRYIRYLPWVVISVAIMLVAAYIKLRYSTPIYSISSKLLVGSQPMQGSRGDKFDDIFMGQQSEKINDEIELIKSRSMASRVILSLGIQKEVYNIGKIRSTIVYYGDVPFNFEILEIADSSRGFGVQLSFQDKYFTLNEQPQKHFYNEVIAQSGTKFRITANNKSWKGFSSNDFIVSWSPLERMAEGLSKSIGVNRVNDYTNMLALSYQSENTKLGVDVVNQYMEEYRQSSLEDKKEIAAKTLDFINDQLKSVFDELGGVERNLQKYRESKRVFSPEAQTQLFFNELSESNKQQTEHGVSLKITDYLINYLSDTKNRNKIIPTMMGINEPTLLQQITEFNKLQLERETVLKTTAPNNPRILDMETAIEKLRTDMIEALRNVRQTHTLALQEIERKGREANRLISSIPSKEKQLLEVTRQQNILQELYQYLLQKKLETAIASASTISNIKVVESAMATGAPVSPSKKSLYILAVLVGIAIPSGIIFLIEYLNDKIKSKSEIEQLTGAPILGEVGHAEEKNALVVTRNNRKFLAEQFRIIRSNLQYILPNAEKPVILVTSSFSGEGKSFVSTNMGSVLALSGKRTVILEFDIRKPKIMQGLGMQERKGITNYIIGNVALSEIVHPVPDVEGLFVISCGPVPPNPAEMLLHERVSQLFNDLRTQFDAIIIDTAPVGLVSDALTLGRYANATVYIVRHNYTLKKQIQLIEDLYQNKKVPHLSIIINDINARGGYGYYGYGGYGYGYGYGYSGNGGSGGYFENGGPREKGWRKWLPKALKK